MKQDFAKSKHPQKDEKGVKFFDENREGGKVKSQMIIYARNKNEKETKGSRNPPKSWTFNNFQQGRVRKVIESDDTEESNTAYEPSSCDDGRYDPAIAGTRLLSSTNCLVVLARTPMTSTATTPDSPKIAEVSTKAKGKNGKTIENKQKVHQTKGRKKSRDVAKAETLAKTNKDDLKKWKMMKKKIRKEQSKTKGAKKKEAAGDYKMQDTPSTLQEGPVPRGKNKKPKTKQSTTLASSKQKKSSGLVGSAKNH